MERRTKLTIELILNLPLLLILYTLLHETGHLIVMLSAGATIDDFSIFGAHVSAHGGEYTDFSEMWLHANGLLLPLIVTYIYMLLYRKGSESVFYKLFSQLAAIAALGTLLVWIILPFVYMNGKAPAGEDVTQFLNVFTKHGHPLIVSAAAAVLVAAGVFIMIRRGITHNFAETVRTEKPEAKEPTEQ